MNVLDRKVLVLNRAWQVIGEKPVQAALLQMAAGAATGLDIQGEDMMVPVTWEDWLKLPVRFPEEVIHTSKLQVRMPTVIVAVNYAKLPKRRPKFTLRNIARTYNYCDAYTGRRLAPHEWSKDHVLPRSRGGLDAEENVVLASKELNNRKGDHTPEEVGLPRPKIRRLLGEVYTPTHPDHKHFLVQTE